MSELTFSKATEKHRSQSPLDAHFILGITTQTLDRCFSSLPFNFGVPSGGRTSHALYGKFFLLMSPHLLSTLSHFVVLLLPDEIPQTSCKARVCENRRELWGYCICILVGQLPRRTSTWPCSPRFLRGLIYAHWTAFSSVPPCSLLFQYVH